MLKLQRNTQCNLMHNTMHNPMRNPQSQRRVRNGGNPCMNRRIQRIKRIQRIQRMRVASAGNKNKIHVFQPKNAFILRMEVPGVDAKDITIEEFNGEIEIKADKYQDMTYVDPSKANFADVTSRLQDGVLLIRVPRKVPKVFRIPVEASVPPPPAAAPREDNESDFRVFMDLPGVNLDNLVVKVREDEVLLSVRPRRVAPGRRRRCVAGSIRRKVWNIPPSMDRKQAKAYFHAGVLTVMAPRRPDIPSSSVGVRTFSVESATNYDDEKDEFVTTLEEDEFSSDEENDDNEPELDVVG